MDDHTKPPPDGTTSPATRPAGATAAAPLPPRRLRVRVLRYDPKAPEVQAHLQDYELDEADNMTLFLALEEIRDHHDASLACDFVCRAGICGSCGMLVNGRPQLACRTLTASLPTEITLAPLPGFELIADLSVDTGKWMRALGERLRAWIHTASVEPDLDAIEERMDPDLAEQIYELDRCIECGCCVSACGSAQMRDDFMGAVGINKIARFRVDPRDVRTDADYYELVGDDDGVFGCMGLLACHDLCPKELPLRTQIAFIRRRMVREGLAAKKK